MQGLSRIAVLAIATFAMASCGGGGDEGGLPPPKDLIRILAEGTFGNAQIDLVPGQPPVSNGNVITIDTGSDVVRIEDGKTLLVPIAISSEAAALLKRVYGKIGGADEHLEALIDDALFGNAGKSTKKKSAKDLQFAPFVATFPLPETLGDGEFCVEFTADDESGNVSQPSEVCVKVTKTPPVLHVASSASQITANAGTHAEEFFVTVTDEAARPVAGATVHVAAEPYGAPFLSSAETDSNGQLGITILTGPPGTSNLTITASSLGATAQLSIPITSLAIAPDFSFSGAAGHFITADHKPFDQVHIEFVPHSEAPNTFYKMTVPPAGIEIRSSKEAAFFIQEAVDSTEIIDQGVASCSGTGCIAPLDWSVEQPLSLTVTATVVGDAVDFAGQVSDPRNPGAQIPIGTFRVVPNMRTSFAFIRTYDLTQPNNLVCTDRTVRSWTITSATYTQGGVEHPFGELYREFFLQPGACGAIFEGPAAQGPGWDFVMGDEGRLFGPYGPFDPISPAP